MKRLSVFPILVVAAMLLAACIGTGQATIVPAATSSLPNTGGTGIEATQVNPPNLGTEFPTQFPAVVGTAAVPSTGGTSEGNLPYNFLTPQAPVENITSVPPAGGAQATEIPPSSLNSGSVQTSQAYMNTTVPGGQGNVPATGATSEPQIGTYPQSEIQTSQAFEVTSTPSGGVPSTGSSGVNVTPAPNTGVTQASQFVRLQSLMNYSLQDGGGNTLGSISDFIIDVPGTRIDFLVVNANNRQVLVPWAAISSVNDSAQAFVYSYSTALLTGAPAFNRANLDFNNQNWSAGVLSYWNSGAGATATAPGAANNTGSTSGIGSFATLYSQLRNAQVVAAGSTVATITPGGSGSVVLGIVQDAILDRVSGSVPYLLVTMNTNIVGLQNRLIAVPFTGLNRNVGGNTLTLNIDISQLRNVPNFDSTGLPNSLGSGWDTAILNFWSGLFGGAAQPQSTQTP